MPGKAKVLFLCTGNSARSQMAEGFLRHYAGNEFEAYSAGLEPKGLHPLTVKVMQEIGIDISGQRSKSVREYLGYINFGYLIIVCGDAEQKCPTVFVGVNKRMFWPFDDPARIEGTEEEKLAAFRRVRDEIDLKIREWLREMNVPIQNAPLAQSDL
ncbi:MAG: arsenate reductase ArsC [Meiothermus sp.]|uniref:arsenate reductase ArsC n=1 Tax=Meiothermus sp. TaxID=1955249 RepID=UPI0025D6307D|nr:arsenate reductase ArsC [Meiothermus sp.]MCS7069832.1 arsenate reductase ArsC [Meiothermus sp.]MDW8327352.1 arsenate reductase ArsC [Anaerolineales bacterium]